MENNNYEYVFFEYIYKKLNLQSLDVQLNSGGIRPNIVNEESFQKRISPYFILINTGDTENFTPEEQKEFIRLFSNINDISNRDALYQFIERTYKKYFFSKIKEEYTFLIPGNYEYAFPSDAIVLGITYNKFDINCPDEKYEEELVREDRVICNIINYIQEKLAEEFQIKLCVKRIDEYSLKNYDVRL